MAKKVSKHSRAARRGQIDTSTNTTGNAKDLEKVPRMEGTDVIGPVIRATAKNENLLRLKMERKNSTKFKNKKSTSLISKAVRHKQRKAFVLDGKLSTKIEQSINRAREVQYARKSNWETINKVARDSLKAKIGGKKSSDDKMDEDDDWEDIDEELEQSEEQPKIESRPNVYALLGDDVEL